MMRRDVLNLICCGTLLLPLAGLAAQSPCATSHIGFLSSNQVLASIPEYVRADSQLGALVNDYKLDMAKQSAALDSAANNYQDRASVLTATQKTAEVKKLQDAKAALDQHATELTQKSQDDRQRLLGPIEQRVAEVIDGMRAELSCSIIFDVNVQTGIVSADKSLDLTQRVIDRFKAAAGTPVAPPPPPAGTGIKPPTSNGPRKP